MNKIITGVLQISITLGAISAQAQTVSTIVDSPYALPRSVVKIGITIQKEEVKKGPYAKFAQQFLGVIAPLNDKVTYSIAGSSLSAFNEGDASNLYLLSDPVTKNLEQAHINTNTPSCSTPTASTGNNTDIDFPDMGIDPIVSRGTASYDGTRVFVKEKSPQEMAEAAAEAIFTLRKRRFDLITGEAGDGAFGAGLAAAIKEMQRIEDEYMALFIGRKTITKQCHTFNIVPQRDKNNYIICRFSPTNGIVDAADLSGEPLVLTTTIEGETSSAPAEKKAITKGTILHYRVSGAAQCKLMLTTTIIAQERLPLYQFGKTIEIVKPAR